MSLTLKNFTGLFSRFPVQASFQAQSYRYQSNQPEKIKVGHGWTDWRMIKDWKKRNEVACQSEMRLRLNTLRKNDIIPPELKELATQEIAALPRYGCISQLQNRCSITSRARGVVRKYRLSRIVWRHLADYNYLSGWQRARW